MKKLLFIFGIIFLLGACNSVKRNQKLLSIGNYEQAIEFGVKKLQKNQSSKKRDGHIAIIEQAFQKFVAKAKQLKRIEQRNYDCLITSIMFVNV